MRSGGKGREPHQAGPLFAAAPVRGRRPGRRNEALRRGWLEWNIRDVVAKLYLVRHGETEWSLSGQHTGRTDIPLTAHGEDEARRLIPGLKGIEFSAALCSPRQRALRTCELAGLGALAQVEPDLAEWDYGDYEGLRTPEIVKERPGWNIFADGCPNG